MCVECTSLDSQHRIMLAAMKAGKEGRAVDLAEDLKQHVRTCPHCNAAFPSWVTAFAGMKRLTEETELMERGALGNPSVLRRTVKEGVALFQPAEIEDGLGLMVIVGDRSPYDARRAVRITRAQFENWE